MNFGKTATAVAVALSVTSAPVLAQTDASRLSVSAAQRAGAPAEEANEMGGGFLIPLLALGAIILGILVLLDDDEDLPESP
jgi:hypothetical protein